MKSVKTVNHHNKDWNTVYPSPITQSSMIGRYSRYHGMFLMILIFIGLLAGITPAGNAYIDLNNLTGTAAGYVWLRLTILTAVAAMGVYWGEDRYEHKSKIARYWYVVLDAEFKETVKLWRKKGKVWYHNDDDILWDSSSNSSILFHITLNGGLGFTLNLPSALKTKLAPKVYKLHLKDERNLILGAKPLRVIGD